MSTHENQIVFGAGGVTLSSRLIDGQFPNYRQLLPESYEHEVTLEQDGVPGGRAPRQPDGTEKRAAAPAVRAGLGDPVRPDAGRR